MLRMVSLADRGLAPGHSLVLPLAGFVTILAIAGWIACPIPALRQLWIEHDVENPLTPKGILTFMVAHPEVEVIVSSYGKQGEYNWYAHSWTRCEIESLAVRGKGF